MERAQKQKIRHFARHGGAKNNSQTRKIFLACSGELLYSSFANTFTAARE